MKFFYIPKTTVMTSMNENEIQHIKRQIKDQKSNYWMSNKLTDFLNRILS